MTHQNYRTDICQATDSGGNLAPTMNAHRQHEQCWGAGKSWHSLLIHQLLYYGNGIAAALLFLMWLTISSLVEVHNKWNKTENKSSVYCGWERPLICAAAEIFTSFLSGNDQTLYLLFNLENSIFLQLNQNMA